MYDVSFEILLIQLAFVICVICLCYGLYQLILPNMKLKTYLRFENMYHNGELFIKEICMKVLCMRKTIFGVMVVC